MADFKEPDDSKRVMKLFEDGRKFTEDLLRENERLRAINARLKNDCRDLEGRNVLGTQAQLQSRIESMEAELAHLRTENQELKDQYSSVEEENREFAQRYIAVERQNNDLINLYVATHRLHSTLDYQDVIKIIKEIVINMIGTEDFGIYRVDDTKQKLLLVGHEGEECGSLPPPTLATSAVAECLKNAAVFVAPEGTSFHTRADEPIACVPLKVGSRVKWIIAIFRLLSQKEAFKPADFEIFELLAVHAAGAIQVAELVSRTAGMAAELGQPERLMVT